MRHIWILMFLVLLTACSKESGQAPPVGQPEIVDKVPVMAGVFDPAAAAYVLRPGTATITGEVFSAGKEGRVFRGRDARIRLIPQTAYAGEYITKLFGDSNVYRWGASVKGVDKRFLQSMRFATADNLGKYKFFGVPQGSYYVYARAQLLSGYFAVYRRVTIAKGQILKLPLSDK